MIRTMKKIEIFTIVLVFLFNILILPVSAENNKINDLESVPQKDGVYKLPNHPDMKVRVFVHYPKMFGKGKPAPTPSPSCSDSTSESVVGSAGWYLPQNWTYTLNTGSVPSSVGGKNLESIARNSFQAWVNAINNQIYVSQLGTSSDIKPNSDDGINLIAWGTTPSNALAVTYTMYWTSGPNTGKVAGVDTIMNRKVHWSWNECNNNSYDVQDVLTHEIGHWMGMTDEYSNGYSENTMFGYASTAETKKNTLTNGDILGVRSIYTIQ